ncbi:hypothetical protein A9Q81_26980 [Gammaproteobacteria bacterium 42_54_T18]|nr:hypothetical protein A9Q81_26980 [Gammaproteobacteria bacterium 42_54_T18]
MILADAIVTCLRELDLRYMFGVSGANIEHVHDAVFRLGQQGKGQHGFETVMTKSEYGAAFMADARARTHNTLGVCCATSGGGMMNLAVGIAESYAHAVPVLALVGQPPIAQEGRGSFQDSSGIGTTVNALAMWQAISKFSCKIESADQFWPLFLEALAQPFSGRHGPSVMLLPRDVMGLEVGDIPKFFLSSIPLESDVQDSEQNINEVWKRLSRAENPVLILGSGVARHNAENAARAFVESSNIRVVSTLSCPGIFSNDDKRYMGMIGVAGHPSAHSFIEEKADFILSVGTQLRAMTRATLESALTEKSLVMVNSDFQELDESLNPCTLLKSDASVFFDALNEKQEASPLQFFVDDVLSPVTCFAPQKIQYQQLVDDALANVRCNGLTQSAALTVVNQYLPEKGHILFDAGNCAAAAAHFLKIPPNVSTNIALGMGGMGYAIAGAIGAQLGESEPSRTTVLCGDGAFMMTGLEIHTAVDLQLPILWIVFNNNMHGMCVTRQQLYFSGRIEGNTYGSVDIATISKGFGGEERIWAKTATSLTELDALLDEYVSRRAHIPGVLELKITEEELPPFMPFVTPDAEVQKAW